MFANRMRGILFVLIIIVSTKTFGQEKPKALAKYKDVERIGNFATRWYFDIRGTSLIWKRTLTLYSDSTYHYIYRGGECATFDEDKKGTWAIDNDTLKLRLDDDMFFWHYMMANGKLYDLQTDIRKNPDNWEMK